MNLFTLENMGLTIEKKPILKTITLTIKEGESTAFIGQSGAGKTSLARVLCGLHKPTYGKIFYKKTQLKELNFNEKKAFSRDVQMVFQNPTSSLNPMMSVREILIEPLYIHAISYTSQTLKQYLQMVELPSAILDSKPKELSGGQQQRVCLARALILKPKILILDEVTCSLDLFTQSHIIKLLAQLKETYGLTYIFISHDLALTDHLCTRFIVLKNKLIVDDFRSKDLFSEKRAPYTKTLLQACQKLTCHEESKPCMEHPEELLEPQLQ